LLFATNQGEHDGLPRSVNRIGRRKLYFSIFDLLWKVVCASFAKIVLKSAIPV